MAHRISAVGAGKGQKNPDIPSHWSRWLTKHHHLDITANKTLRFTDIIFIAA